MEGEEVLGMLIAALFVGCMWMADRYITQPFIAALEARTASTPAGEE